MYTHDSDAEGESCNRVLECSACRRRRQVRVLVMDGVGGANDFEGRTSLTGVVRTAGNGEKAFTDA